MAHSVSVADSDANPKTVSRTYWLERPNNLTGPAPLLVLADIPGGADTSYWKSYSVTGKYEILMLDPTLHSGQPSIPAISSTMFLASYPYSNCGATGVEVCDDIPYAKAALDAALASENIDRNKLYAVGASKGAAFVHDEVCDVRTTGYFHAAAAVSLSINSNSYGNVQSVAPECPALLSTSNGFGGGAGLPANTNLSLMWAYGTNDSLACGSGHPDCLDTGQTWGNGQWMFSASQLAGDSSPASPATSTGTDVVFGHKALGCSGTPSVDTTYGTGNLLRKRIYTGCTNPNRATETLRVATGGHAVVGLQGVGGVDVPAEVWSFFTAYGG